MVIFTVVESFFLSTGQLHVISDITQTPEQYKNGDRLELIRPDGTITHAKCWQIRVVEDPEFSLANPAYERPLAFYLEELKKEDAPPGTQAIMHRTIGTD